MIDVKPPRLLLKLERLIDTAWRGIKRLVKYLTTPPKTINEYRDKATQIALVSIPAAVWGLAVIVLIRG